MKSICYNNFGKYYCEAVYTPTVDEFSNGGAVINEKKDRQRLLALPFDEPDF